jgi:hypothetical protein
MNKSLIIVLFLYFFVNGFCLSTQKREKIAPHLDFVYVKKTDGSRLLKASLYLLKNKNNVPVKANTLKFCLNDSNVISVKTNEEGIAYLLIDAKTKVFVNDKGLSKYLVNYNGNDSLESISQEILVKDAFIQLVLEEIDSVRTIKAQLREINESGDTVPIAGETINFYVPRMFSLLKIGEESTDDGGWITLEFPNDLPGNPDSTILVIARLEEHEKFANIEVSKIAQWGIPIIHRIPESHRALWTEIAPVWMIVTLTIMLMGVWGHYIYVMVQLWLIKKESKEQKA